MSKATETAIKMLESLSEEAQERVVEGLRDLVEEVRDEERWDLLFEERKAGLMTAARRVREEVAAGKAEGMDYDKL
ncbi:MAG: hypothetical protein HYV08_03400 [Deltaproteobacteria bacterium]|nr:hypothetical protein [Deltaproteobacteria bacterium]